MGKESDHLDFNSTDPAMQESVDRKIWQMKTDGVRRDQIDLDLGCSPRRVKEALDRPNPFETKHTAVLEPWQFEELKTVSPVPPKNALKEFLESKKRFLSAHKAGGVSSRVKPAPEPEVLRPKTSGAKAPVPPVESIPEPTIEEKNAASANLERVTRYVCHACNTSVEELRATDTNLRVSAYRDAALLILQFLGVRVEITGEHFGRSGAESRAAFALARKNVFVKTQSTHVFTRMVCTMMNIDFQRLLTKLL